MKRVIFSLILAFLAWLSYLNIFNWAIKVLTVCILVKLIIVLLALCLSFIVQKLLTNTAGSIILKDKIEELGNLGSAYTQTTKMLLILFTFYCLYRCQNTALLWIYASSAIIDNFISYFWRLYIDKMNST